MTNAQHPPADGIVQPVLKALGIALAVGVDVDGQGADSVDVQPMQTAPVAVLLVVLPDADGVVHEHTVHARAICCNDHRMVSALTTRLETVSAGDCIACDASAQLEIPNTQPTYLRRVLGGAIPHQYRVGIQICSWVRHQQNDKAHGQYMISLLSSCLVQPCAVLQVERTSYGAS